MNILHWNFVERSCPTNHHQLYTYCRSWKAELTTCISSYPLAMLSYETCEFVHVTSSGLRHCLRVSAHSQRLTEEVKLTIVRLAVGYFYRSLSESLFPCTKSLKIYYWDRGSSTQWLSKKITLVNLTQTRAKTITWQISFFAESFNSNSSVWSCWTTSSATRTAATTTGWSSTSVLLRRRITNRTRQWRTHNRYLVHSSQLSTLFVFQKWTNSIKNRYSRFVVEANTKSLWPKSSWGWIVNTEHLNTGFI